MRTRNVVTFFLLFFILFSYVGGSYYPAYADCSTNTAHPCTLGGLFSLAPTVVQAMIAIAVVVFFFLIITAGYLFITAAGDRERIDKARKSLIFTTLGFALVFLPFVLIQLITTVTQNNEGVNVNQGNGQISFQPNSTFTATPLPQSLINTLTPTPVPPSYVINFTGPGIAFNYYGGWTPPLSCSGAAPTSHVDLPYYINKYGFYKTLKGGYITPAQPVVIDNGQRTLLSAMWPFAVAASDCFDQVHQNMFTADFHSIEPELLLWWTYEEGIGAHVNLSNCYNEAPPGNLTIFNYITNCNHPSFWQLGYGIQYANVPANVYSSNGDEYLMEGFKLLRGDPDNPQLVHQVGQSVLDYLQTVNTIPRCGGYSCTFPTETVSQILSGVNLSTVGNASQAPIDNWWAAVLSLDPAINSYLNAYGLALFERYGPNTTRGWGGCYYTDDCWTRMSNQLEDILAAVQNGTQYTGGGN